MKLHSEPLTRYGPLVVGLYLCTHIDILLSPKMGIVSFHDYFHNSCKCPTLQWTMGVIDDWRNANEAFLLNE